MKITKLLPVLALLLLFVGCAKKETPLPPPSTAVILQAYEMNIHMLRYFQFKPLGEPAFTPDASYAEVSNAWIADAYQKWERYIFDNDVVHWEVGFDCNKYAQSFAAFAQLEYYKFSWGKAGMAQALAVGEVWYQTKRGGHAINVMITARGVIFFEPQTGKEVRLTDAERKSIYFARF